MQIVTIVVDKFERQHSFSSLPRTFPDGNACPVQILPPANLALWAEKKNCGTLNPMRRAQSILVVIALLATPLALLSRVYSNTSADCGQFCCLPHAAHASQTHQSMADGMSCQHGAAGHMLICSMKSGGHHADYGLNSPVDPTSVSSLIRIAPPAASRRALTSQVEFPAFGLH